ncbi:coproporphyrinogen III oxidase [Roseibium aggregatum IAM 12614]|uniref:Coproporphyrinogen-III oxidase n=1 Tax=Roseibium aggregatum (strain ATCC 25650 / DSM 13394 / JCM 20685 / NBRC 16684 / NCIMB 2208 / IAM 12614 / B1) TaxID=384765 RepID=A0NRD1_ROSAI|nr:oxygen-independent coproporphyrinogen III oxidase [Roseibium aggregatum]EAV44712.1 coproporphyrinogen III oxidase [Roseibium aggregatum IAM 12614]
MMKDPLSYAMRNVPRYTSYPTAPHFHDGVTAGVYADWLKTVSSQDSLSLYLHVPYCRELCHYCGCHTKATRQDAPLKAYAATLGQEINLVAEHMPHTGPVRHIHWGGGTPSLLPRESLIDLTGLMRVSFDLAPDLEHAIELDPRLVTEQLAETLAIIGVNRASLGVQDFDPNVQKAIGRMQPYRVVKQAVEFLAEAGVTALNFDLMYGLPGQSPETILDTVEKTLSLYPGRIALFGYAHVPWMRKHQRLIDESTLPNAAERLALADLARAELLKAGYIAIGLDHFARPDDSMAIALSDGSLKRNFQGYTTDQGEQLIGFGVSSIGRLSAGYIQNISDVGNWRRAIMAGELPVSKGLALSADDRLRGRIIEELMTNYTCDLTPACRAYGLPTSHLADAFDALQDLAADGLVRLDVQGGTAKVEVTEAGRPYVRLAAAAFDAYLAASQASGKARHSAAV